MKKCLDDGWLQVSETVESDTMWRTPMPVIWNLVDSQPSIIQFPPGFWPPNRGKKIYKFTETREHKVR